jgi:lipooligosaccharide transport system ATP-binding protein
MQSCGARTAVAESAATCAVGSRWHGGLAILPRMELAIQTEALAKQYGEVQAVRGVDISVRVGECVGVLGPNGAGKTTTVKMVACFLPITSGDVRVFGLNVKTHPREVKAQIGVCHQENNLDPDFTVLKNLLVWARYFDIPRAEAKRRSEELLAMMQLTEKAKVRIEALSGGMKRRLVLARALLNRPRLLILDEPTTGLDPQARQLIWQRVRRLREEGVTILLTTHYMEEASQLCDRVILMDEGRVLLEGTPASLIAQEAGSSVVEIWNVDPRVRDLVEERKWIAQEEDGRLYLYERDGEEIARSIVEIAPDQERLIRQATLEDVFLLRAGRSLRE